MANLSEQEQLRLLALTLRELIATVSILHHEHDPDSSYDVPHIVEKAELLLKSFRL